MMICELAPAKINLTLEILNKRDDGYHDIKSVMQTIDLCDILTFGSNDWVQVIPEYCNLPAEDTLPWNENANYLKDNLVYKAASILKEETGCRKGALIQLKKCIPSSAGLGGGSSDAAATLKGLNKLWDLKLSTEELAEIGSKIGSDISFFIYGGTCLSRGRGEIIEKVQSISKKWLAVILLPIRIKDKTKKLYSHVTFKNYSDGKFTEALIESINNNGNDDSQKLINKISTNHANGKNNTNGFEIDSLLFNVFETIYSDYFEEYKNWAEKLNKIINKPFHLSGSGPSIFYISDKEKEIIEIARKIGEIEDLKLTKYIAQTVP